MTLNRREALTASALPLMAVRGRRLLLRGGGSRSCIFASVGNVRVDVKSRPYVGIPAAIIWPGICNHN